MTLLLSRRTILDRTIGISIRYFLFMSTAITWIGSFSLCSLYLVSYEESKGLKSRLLVNFVMQGFTLCFLLAINSVAGAVGTLIQSAMMLRFYMGGISIYLVGISIYLLLIAIYQEELFKAVFMELRTQIVVMYLRNDSYRNFINSFQVRFKCCGLSHTGIDDWQLVNEFRCWRDTVSPMACAVPFSCCFNHTAPNLVCRPSELSRVQLLHPSGCGDVFRTFYYDHMGWALVFFLSFLFIKLVDIFLANRILNQMVLLQKYSRFNAQQLEIVSQHAADLQHTP